MKRNIIIPGDFSEMKRGQLRVVISGFLNMCNDTNIQPIDIQRDLADYILGRKQYVYHTKREKYYLMVDRLAERFDWLFTFENNLVSINFNTTENILPTLSGLVGPQSHGADLSFGEFRTVVDIMQQYNEDSSPDTLDALVGSLYRRPATKTKRNDFNGSFRQPFNKHNIERYAKKAKDIRDEYKYVVYLWFANFCKYLIEGTFYIEGKEVEFSSIFQTNEDPDAKQTNDSLGMLSILFTLSDAGTFGNVQETDNALLLDVMLKLLNDYNLAKELKKK